MKNFVQFAFTLCVCLVLSCRGTSYDQPFETTILVVDSDEKPVKNRQVVLREKGLARVTDEKGKVVINYTLPGGTDAFQSKITFSINENEDSLVKGINSALILFDGQGQKGAILNTLKIRVDSLIPFKVRIRKTSATPIDLLVKTRADSYEIHNCSYKTPCSEHIFTEFRKPKAGITDTIIIVKGYANTNFSILGYKENVLSNDFYSATINPKIARDSISLVEFK
jgi:hypothetical protein